MKSTISAMALALFASTALATPSIAAELNCERVPTKMNGIEAVWVGPDCPPWMMPVPKATGGGSGGVGKFNITPSKPTDPETEEPGGGDDNGPGDGPGAPPGDDDPVEDARPV